MAKETKKVDSINLVTKIQKQHGTLCVTIPKAIVNRQGLEQGDYVVFRMVEGWSFSEFALFQKGKSKIDGSKRNTINTNPNRDPRR